MKSGGQTKVTDIGVGRQLLCKEKPGTRITSQCAKQVKKTVTVAKRGLTAKQQKLWQKYVYTSALLQAQRFCDAQSKKPIMTIMAAEPQPKIPSTSERYKTCVKNVLSGAQKVEGPFKAKFKWSDFLVNGAKIIKKLPIVGIRVD